MIDVVVGNTCIGAFVIGKIAAHCYTYSNFRQALHRSIREGRSLKSIDKFLLIATSHTEALMHTAPSDCETQKFGRCGGESLLPSGDKRRRKKL